MEINREAELFTRYPKIFAEAQLPSEESAMGRGIECGDGWFGLIDALCQYLQETTDRGLEPQIVAIQVKEKLGGLRFYVRGSQASRSQRGAIAFAELLSQQLCEICGAWGATISATGNLRTRCGVHVNA
jgi:hypothetical protein